MERYPDYRFVVSQAQHLAWMRDLYPDLWGRIKERIAEGRIEPTGSMWVESDCNIPSGESLVRQIVHGKRFYLDELGIETNDVWLPDVFGYSAALPQIMKQSGIRWFLTQKLSWNQYNQLPHHTLLVGGNRRIPRLHPFPARRYLQREHERPRAPLQCREFQGPRSGHPLALSLRVGRRWRGSDRRHAGIGPPTGRHRRTAPPPHGRVSTVLHRGRGRHPRPGGLGGRALPRAAPGYLHDPGRHQAREPPGRVRPARHRAVGFPGLPIRPTAG